MVYEPVRLSREHLREATVTWCELLSVHVSVLLCVADLVDVIARFSCHAHRRCVAGKTPPPE